MCRIAHFPERPTVFWEAPMCVGENRFVTRLGSHFVLCWTNSRTTLLQLKDTIGPPNFLKTPCLRFQFRLGIWQRQFLSQCFLIWRQVQLLSCFGSPLFYSCMLLPSYLFRICFLFVFFYVLYAVSMYSTPWLWYFDKRVDSPTHNEYFLPLLYTILCFL